MFLCGNPDLLCVTDLGSGIVLCSNTQGPGAAAATAAAAMEKDPSCPAQKPVTEPKGETALNDWRTQDLCVATRKNEDYFFSSVRFNLRGGRSHFCSPS